MAFFDKVGGYLSKLNTANEETGEPSFFQKLGAFGGSLQGDDTGMQKVQQQRAAGQTRLKNTQQIQYLDEIAQRVGLSPNMRLLLRSNPDKFAEVLAKNLEAYNLTEGMGHYNPGSEEDNRYNPRTFVTGDEILQTQEGGGVDSVYTRQPSFAEDTDRMKTEFDINKPVSVAEGAILYNPYTGEKLIENVKNFAPPRASSGSKGMPPPPPGAVIVGGR